MSELPLGDIRMTLSQIILRNKAIHRTLHTTCYYFKRAQTQAKPNNVSFGNPYSLEKNFFFQKGSQLYTKFGILLILVSKHTDEQEPRVRVWTVIQFLG